MPNNCLSKPRVCSVKPGSSVRTVTTQRLFDYTKFHVGLYGSLVFGTVALVTIGDTVALRESLVLLLVVYAVVSWVIAGFCGGTILGSLVDFDGPLCCFRAERWGILPIRGRDWESMEHMVFWVGVFSALAAFYFAVNIVASGSGVSGAG